MPNNDEMIALWNGELTAAWATHPDRYDLMLAEIGERVLGAAELQPGERVLDVGCGTGALGRAAAGVVGTSGHVTGVDIARPLLELARARASAAGIHNVDLVEADAQSDDLPNGPFDAVISRFGVMFFADPTAAFRNLLSATARGGRLAFVAWQPLAQNEWAMFPVLAMMPHLGLPQPPAPDAPGPFAFGDADRVRTILGDAGWTDVAMDAVATDVPVGGAATATDAVTFYREDAFGKQLFGAADAEKQEAAAGALRDALSERATSGGIRLGAAVWIVTARSGS